METLLLKSLSVFVLVALQNLLWVACITYTTNNQPWRAAAASSVTVLATSAVTLSWVSDTRMILPAALGAFVGTCVSVKWRISG